MSKKEGKTINDKKDESSKKRGWEKFKSEWDNAFSMSVAEDAFNDNDIKLINDVALDIVSRSMAAPAIMFLVSIKPVSFLMAQGMQFIKPFMPGISNDTNSKEFANRFMVSTLISNPAAYSRFALLMESRDAVEMMIDALEKYEDERAQKERREKRQDKEKK